MRVFCYIVLIGSTVYYAVLLDPVSIILCWMAVGIFYFVWDTIITFLGFRQQKIESNIYLSQHNYTSSDDPTRPNENLPAIIDINRHRRVK